MLPVVAVQSLSQVQLFVTPWTAALQASLSFTVFLSLLKLMSIESVMPSNPSHPPSLPSPSALNLSQHQVFLVSQLCIRWPKYWSFSFSPSSEYSVLISFRIDWFDLLAFQGDPEMSTLRNKTDFSFQTYLGEIGKFCWVNQG